MRPTIYIAGPMRGLPDFNRAAFNAAAERLAANGWQPVNPVDIERILPCVDEDEVSEDNLQKLLEVECEIVKRVDAIYLLKGWWKSEGAKKELGAYLLKDVRYIHCEENGTPKPMRRCAQGAAVKEGER